MPTFTPVIRNKRKDGLYTVYIMIVHNSKPAYLRTDLLVRDCDVIRNAIKDSFVLKTCYGRIQHFSEVLNKVDYKNWTVTQVRDFLVSIDNSTSFSAFCRQFIIELEQKGSENNASIYRASLRSFEHYMDCDTISFQEVTHESLTGWLQSLWLKNRARTLYPTCLRAMFDKARLLSTDGMSDIVIKHNPWLGMEIPQYRSVRKKAVSIEECRKFFESPIPQDVRWRQRASLGKDVAMLVFCLAGINTIDLFKLRKSDYSGGVLHYMRAKTSSRRSDSAYFEIRVPELLKDVFSRNLAPEDSEWLFSFSQIYKDPKTFNVSINAGIKRIASEAGLSDDFSAYTFRHTWATIAQNQCHASFAEIGFAMNHSDHATTKGYIKIDFTPAWILNESVIGAVFEAKADDTPQTKSVRNGICIDPDNMVYGRAYHQGKLMAEVSDIGFNNAESAIKRLAAKLPADIGINESVQFRIQNLDNGGQTVYERMKGKDF